MGSESALAVQSSSVTTPTVNVNVQGGTQERQLAARIAGHVSRVMDKSYRGFRASATQQHASAAATSGKASKKNG
jgi:hypothetical protein